MPLTNKERDEIYSDLSLLKKYLDDEELLSFLKKKFHSFRYKIIDSFKKDQSFFDDLTEK